MFLFKNHAENETAKLVPEVNAAVQYQYIFSAA